MAAELVLHNLDQPDGFGYQVAFVKPDGKTYDASQYVTELNIFESMFTKAMCIQVGVFDGGGLTEQIALQPGDSIAVTIMKREDLPKLVKTFVITSMGSVGREANASAKTYSISGMTGTAALNKKNVVYQALGGKHHNMVRTVCANYLGIPLSLLDFEPTLSSASVVAPGKKPFDLLSQLTLHSVSEEFGVKQSLYFFFEDRDKWRFKTLKRIVLDADVHELHVSVDKNVDGEIDLKKIQHFVQLKAGSQNERMAAGMYENEVMEFDHLSRRVSSKLWDWVAEAKELMVLGEGKFLDETQNVVPWLNSSASRGTKNLVKIRSSEEAFDNTNNYREKFGSMVAQKAMFNQIIYAVQIFGTTEIKVGDVLDITAPSMRMQDQTGELDYSLQGRFLVGDIRHRIIGGEKYVTILNIFKDGMETEFKPEESK